MTEDTTQFKDFDDAVAEVEERRTSFQFAGEMYEVDLNVDGGSILRWMEHADKIEAIPQLLRTFLGDEDYERITDAGVEWSRYEALVSWLASELGDSGN